MKVLRLFRTVGKEGRLTINIPSELGEHVEIIVLPASFKQYDSEPPGYFECVGEDGTEYKVENWTDEAFDRVSRASAIKDDGTRAEDLFDV